MMYESLRRKQLSTAVLERETTTIDKNPVALNIGPQTMEDFIFNRAKVLTPEHQKHRREHDKCGGSFVFQPRVMNDCVSPKMFLENGTYKAFNPPRKYHY